MSVRRKSFIVTALVIGCVLLHVYSSNEMRVEEGYSRKISPAISSALRTAFGWSPVSIGDIFYGILTAWLLWMLVRFVKGIIRSGRRRQPGRYLQNAFLNLIIFCSSLYLVFNLIWGINYDRKGIAWQMQLDVGKYSKEDLRNINLVLAEKVNACKRTCLRKAEGFPARRNLYDRTVQVYAEAAKLNPNFLYDQPSLKTSMWGWLGNYTGFTGYYNPFSGEAQVNTNVPAFLQPFIACHEVAHQLGYAKEMEANFVAYLAVSSSRDTFFLYSTYLDLFAYANRNLFIVDSTVARDVRRSLDSSVINDFKEWSAFNRRHQNAFEPIVRWVYGKYLKGNKQPQGILSYDEVTAFIIAYYKKYGRL